MSAKRKGDVCRVLLDKEQTSLIAELVAKLRGDYCKVDSSKLLNQIVAIFFQKYTAHEYDNIAATFFNKRGYLRNLVNSTPIDDIDASIKAYLCKGRSTCACRMIRKWLWSVDLWNNKFTLLSPKHNIAQSRSG